MELLLIDHFFVTACRAHRIEKTHLATDRRTVTVFASPVSDHFLISNAVN